MCSFTIPFEKFNACSKVFVECIICFGELKEASSPSPSSSSWLASQFNPKAYYNTTK